MSIIEQSSIMDPEEKSDSGTGEDGEFLVMSIHHGNNFTGAAIYDAGDAVLQLVQDVNDSNLDRFRSLMSQLQPAHLIVSMKQPQEFLQAVKEKVSLIMVVKFVAV